jgi:hypothetical protein
MGVIEVKLPSGVKLAVDLPIAWSAQKQLLGFPAASR